MSVSVEPGSFRDPSGFVFTRGGALYRQVQESYRDEYDRLMSCGLYPKLVDDGLLVAHTEDSLDLAAAPGAYRVLRPERVPFISYPYEWCFSQLKDAALATLHIQQEALVRGMSLKDASAYNIQFRNGKPVLIDTLSFETYREGQPWPAYRQFCQHFLAPLALMARTDARLGTLLRLYVDGIPLDLASRLLPVRTRLDAGLLTHIHLHASAQKRGGARPGGADQAAAGAGQTGRVSCTALFGLLDSLETAVRRLSWKAAGTVWADYYAETNYSQAAMEGKRGLVSAMLDAIAPQPRSAWDLGANTGVFSRLASERGIETIAWDVDPAAVEKNYLAVRSSSDSHVLPLVQDLTNPSPDLGWALRERQSLVRRGPADLVLALALVHHLAIGNNVPLAEVARFLRSVGRWLVIEFVPKRDSQVQRLLASREDVFPGYTAEGFESAFDGAFDIVQRAAVPDSERTLYLMRAKPEASERRAGAVSSRVVRRIRKDRSAAAAASGTA